MEPDSFFKDILRTCFKSFFRVIAIGLAFIVLLVLLSIAFHKPAQVPQATSAAVVANHLWQAKPLSQTAPTILKINIEGVIGLDHLTQNRVRDILIDSIDGEITQDQVKGVLLVINTPGGTVDDSDGIYRLIQEYKKRVKVPVFAYVDGICASGGMYIACAADKIIVSDASLIGHVGVIMPTAFNFSALMDHLGIQSKTIISGKDKDELNPFRPWTATEGTSFQAITDAFYQRFISIVSQNRPKLTKESLITQGAVVYPVQEALALGYCDATANTIDDVLLEMTTELKIENNYQVVELHTKTWVDELFGASQALFNGRVEHHVRFPGDIHPSLHGKPLYLFRQEPVSYTP